MAWRRLIFETDKVGAEAISEALSEMGVNDASPPAAALEERAKLAA